ncbi:MAG: glycosyltransferase family 4 protein [Candidatus Krumholzibacteria bacterium]|nr:glycosyltransferase family 4 protein [Candidatus Krumholzibacteria bacterium]
MKILVVNSSLRLGGAESMSVELANALARAGSTVAFGSAPGPLRESLDGEVTWLETANPSFTLLRAARDMRARARAFRPQVIHAHGPSCAVAAAMATRGMRPRPIRVLTHHSRGFFRGPQAASGWLVRHAADHFVAITADKRAAFEGFGVAAERISLIPNFVDTGAIAARVAAADRRAVRSGLGIAADARVACIAGRALPEKGFDRFARIVALAASRFEGELHGVALGDGPALDQARRAAADAGGAARVHFLGYQRDVLPYLAASDVVLFPSSHAEVLPMFLIEASAAGLPIVCSGIPGNREVVRDGENGAIVEGDDADYAERLLELLRAPERATAMGAAGRRAAVERFDRTRVVAATLALYRSLVERGPGSAR